MRILLCGASGFIGGHLLTALRAAGHDVRCLARTPDQAARPGSLQGDFATDTSPGTWAPRLDGIDAVINAVGIIRETGTARFEPLHGRAPVALFEAAAARNLRIIQISALGTPSGDLPDRPEPYFRWRAMADRRLLEISPGALILRPSIVYGPGDHSMALFRGLAALPITPLIGDGRQPLAPVHVADLAAAVVRAVADPSIRGAVDAAGPETLEFRDLLARLRAWMGAGPLRAVQVPVGLVRAGAKIADIAGIGPITSDELSMLLAGNAAPPDAFTRAFGFAPRTLAAGLGPCTEADRWHARLSMLRLPLRLSVASVWVATGAFCLFAVPPEVRYGMLGDSGFTGPAAERFLDALCLLEIPLGLLTAVGWRVRWLGSLQLLMISSFSVFLLFTQTHWWVHPYGPLTKNIPLMGAILAMMCLEEE